MDTREHDQHISRMVGDTKRLLLGKGLDATTYSTVENVLNDLGASVKLSYEASTRYAHLRLVGARLGSGRPIEEQTVLYLSDLDALVDKDIERRAARDGTAPTPELAADPMATVVTTLVKTLIEDEHDKAVQALERPDLQGWFVGRVLRMTGGAIPRAVIEATVADGLSKVS